MEVQPKDTSKGHFYVSLVKSIIRIGAGGCLIQGNLVAAGALLIFAEMLGIVEELVWPTNDYKNYILKIYPETFQNIPNRIEIIINVLHL